MRACRFKYSDEDIGFTGLSIFAYHWRESPHQRVVSISPLGIPGREHTATLGFERSKCVKYVVTTIALNLEVLKDDLIMPHGGGTLSRFYDRRHNNTVLWKKESLHFSVFSLCSLGL